ncbi:hypothetical protein POTOM_051790 [Populus tomentosa]|uniref:Uncharacterized protein n=1 Tax=Populus tomentosa TaxID=118781 RepID=A0A8X8C1J4_POPTO|nr:hypothetical protein POTOM_051790 [Populus tomentosa]
MLWKAQVIPILRGHGLLAYVINDISSLELTIIGTYGTLQSNPAAATWLRIDQLILGWINSSLQDGPLSQAINTQVIAILRGHGLFAYLTNDISYPELTIIGVDCTLQSNPAAATWLRTDQLILG